MKQFLKRLFFPGGLRHRRIRGGIAKGMWMQIDPASQSQRYLGLDERELFGPLKRLVSGCKSLVDVGANDGYYTMAFLHSSAERVVAYEPGPAVERLLANALANGYQPGARFAVEKRPVGASGDAIRLSEVIHGLPRPLLIKVDIDGGELELLQSVEDVESFASIRWLIETHSESLEMQCVAWLHACGYKTETIHPAAWRKLLPERRPIAHNRWLVAERGDEGRSAGTAQ